jgi:hypothetical protein
MKRSFSGVSSLLCLLGASSIAGACWITTTTDCCSLAGISLNATRKCGLLQDQDCPDIAVTNTANIDKAVSAATGKMDKSSGTSYTCTYKLGRCTGTFGSNLCAYNAEQSIGCTSSSATGATCPASEGEPPEN